MKLALFLLNERGYECLNYICNSYLEKKGIEFIVILDKDSGNKEDFFDEMKELCVKNNLKYFKREEYLHTDVDYAVAIGWRRLIYGINDLIVLHDSILPKYRGFSPLVNMLINGEKEIGVTALFANSEMDKGNIIKQKKVYIEYPIKIKSAIKIITSLYVEIIKELIDLMNSGEVIKSFNQNEDEATYSIWRDKFDYYIDWSRSASEIKRFIDAVGFPYDGAKTRINDEVIRVTQVEEVEGISFELNHFGKIISFKDGYPIVICGEGAIMIKASEYENSKQFNFKKLRIRLE